MDGVLKNFGEHYASVKLHGEGAHHDSEQTEYLKV